MTFGNRTEAFRALVGSHNYNLNTETSDKDYKLFVLPTFDDLYFNNQFSKSYIGKTEDIDVHDIRKTSALWWKANVNFVEVLFSNEIKISTVLNKKSISLINEIFERKDDIAKMNLSYFYDACIGMHLTKKKQVDKGTSGTQHLVDKYGYDTKQASHSLRILDFLTRFSDTDFNDFKKAIWYDENDNNRNFLIDMKNGKYTKEEYLKFSEEMFNNVESKLKLVYKSIEPDVETNDFLLDSIKEIVKTELF